MTDWISLRPRKKCDNAQCDRTVNDGVMYCCGGCDAEAQSPTRYWPSHSTRCDERARERGEP